MAPVTLTRREMDLVAALQRQEKEQPGLGASLQELADALGMKSRSNVLRIVRSLEVKGWIKSMPNKVRSLQLLHRLTEDQMEEAKNGPDPGWEDTEILISILRERGIETIANASDEQIVAEVERRGLRPLIVTAYEIDVAARRIGK